MAQNDFLPFATGAGANVDDHATYLAAAYRGTGFNSGTALANQANAPWRQASTGVATLFQTIADLASEDQLDDGNIANKVISFKRMLQYGLQSYKAAGGTANALTLTLDTPPASYVIGMLLKVLALSANTGPTTINVNGLGSRQIVTTAGNALAGGEIVSGSMLQLIYSSSGQFQLVSMPANVGLGTNFVSKAGDTMTGALYTPFIQSNAGQVESQATPTSDALFKARDSTGIEHARFGWDHTTNTPYMANINGVGGTINKSLLLMSDHLEEGQGAGYLISQTRAAAGAGLLKTNTATGIQYAPDFTFLDARYAASGLLVAYADIRHSIGSGQATTLINSVGLNSTTPIVRVNNTLIQVNFGFTLPNTNYVVRGLGNQADNVAIQAVTGNFDYQSGAVGGGSIHWNGQPNTGMYSGIPISAKTTTSFTMVVANFNPSTFDLQPSVFFQG